MKITCIYYTGHWGQTSQGSHGLAGRKSTCSKLCYRQYRQSRQHSVSGIKLINQKTYSTERVENDASARPPNLTSASCDLDLWPPDPQVDRFIPPPVPLNTCQVGAKSVRSFSKYLVHKNGNKLTGGRTDEWPGRKHYATDWRRHKMMSTQQQAFASLMTSSHEYNTTKDKSRYEVMTSNWHYNFYRAMCTQSANYAVARCLSVCLLVTSRYCVKTAKHTSIFFTIGSHTILFFPHQTLWQYSDGDHQKRTSNAGGLWKNRDFRPISRFISEMIQERATFTMKCQ